MKSTEKFRMIGSNIQQTFDVSDIADILLQLKKSFDNQDTIVNHILFEICTLIKSTQLKSVADALNINIHYQSSSDSKQNALQPQNKLQKVAYSLLDANSSEKKEAITYLLKILLGLRKLTSDPNISKNRIDELAAIVGYQLQDIKCSAGTCERLHSIVNYFEHKIINIECALYMIKHHIIDNISNAIISRSHCGHSLLASCTTQYGNLISDYLENITNMHEVHVKNSIYNSISHSYNLDTKPTSRYMFKIVKNKHFDNLLYYIDCKVREEFGNFIYFAQIQNLILEMNEKINLIFEHVDVQIDGRKVVKDNYISMERSFIAIAEQYFGLKSAEKYGGILLKSILKTDQNDMFLYIQNDTKIVIKCVIIKWLIENKYISDVIQIISDNKIIINTGKFLILETTDEFNHNSYTTLCNLHILQEYLSTKYYQRFIQILSNNVILENELSNVIQDVILEVINEIVNEKLIPNHFFKQKVISDYLKVLFDNKVSEGSYLFNENNLYILNTLNNDCDPDILKKADSKFINTLTKIMQFSDVYDNGIFFKVIISVIKEKILSFEDLISIDIMKLHSLFNPNIILFYESMEYQPNNKLLHVFCKLFHMTIDDIFFYTSDLALQCYKKNNRGYNVFPSFDDLMSVPIDVAKELISFNAFKCYAEAKKNNNKAFPSFRELKNFDLKTINFSAERIRFLCSPFIIQSYTKANKINKILIDFKELAKIAVFDNEKITLLLSSNAIEAYLGSLDYPAIFPSFYNLCKLEKDSIAMFISDAALASYTMNLKYTKHFPCFANIHDINNTLAHIILSPNAIHCYQQSRLNNAFPSFKTLIELNIEHISVLVSAPMISCYSSALQGKKFPNFSQIKNIHSEKLKDIMKEFMKKDDYSDFAEAVHKCWMKDATFAFTQEDSALIMKSFLLSLKQYYSIIISKEFLEEEKELILKKLHTCLIQQELSKNSDKSSHAFSEALYKLVLALMSTCISTLETKDKLNDISEFILEQIYKEQTGNNIDKYHSNNTDRNHSNYAANISQKTSLKNIKSLIVKSKDKESNYYSNNRENTDYLTINADTDRSLIINSEKKDRRSPQKYEEFFRYK